MMYLIKTLFSLHSFLFILLFTYYSCSSQKKSAKQIGQYVVEIFEDSKGNIWFGTLEKGVAMYNGETLNYFTVEDGLPSNRITSIIEDKNNHIWFGTGLGISKYNGKEFTNLSKKDGLCSNMISQLFIDSKENFWIGTWKGVCKFKGKSFSKFNIPNPIINTSINEDTKNWITKINEDNKGNIWFAKDGFGAAKYNGKTFNYFLKKDGLNSNCVTEIIFDKNNHIWFGMRVAEKDLFISAI